MRRLALFCFLIASLPGLATADAPLRRLLTADDAKAWQGVGRLNVQGSGFCTGALISETLVLTAAHCMFHPKSKRRITPDRIHFLAGWRKGSMAAHRKARRVVIHPDYDTEGEDQLRIVAADIALVELESPIRASVVKPFARYEELLPGDAVAVVSYAKERSEVPALQEPCYLLRRQSNALVLSCDVNFGASGSPIFVMRDGEPMIASVVSAMAQQSDGSDVALGTSLGAPLDDLMSLIETNNPVFRARKPFDASRELPQVGTGADTGKAAGTGSGFKSVVPPINN